MKKLTKMMDDILVAITFAEAGEFETAKEMLHMAPNALKDEGESLEATTEAA